jgi:hypothetical protein
MTRQPPQFNAITCQHCGAIIALVPPDAWRHTTHLTCSQCQSVRTIKVLDNKERKVYHRDEPALAPA